MYGIDLDSPIKFTKASFRYFNKNEYHITRICEDNVLLMVFDGVLFFTEDGRDFEISAGHYHIQKAGSYQSAKIPSRCPKYLYVHFDAAWSDADHVLEPDGYFDINELSELMNRLDSLSHEGSYYVKKAAVFYELLLTLRRKEKAPTPAYHIAKYIKEHYQSSVTLTDICQKFNFSKNHVINIFKREYGVTPVKYINDQKISRAKYLLEVTSNTVESIALESGFNDYSHFYKLFCKNVGVAPANYREKSRAGSLL